MPEHRPPRATRAGAGSGGSRPSAPAAPGSRERPDYNVYRAPRGPLSRLKGGGDRFKIPRRGGSDSEKPRRRLTPGRIVKIVLALVLLWVLVSVALFAISAETTRGVTDRTEEALSGEGNVLTGSTILVLGSDERSPRIREQLAEMGEDPGDVGRADSILLLEVGFGSVERLSILRDSVAEIPGNGPGRINSAFAIGGTPLMIETVEAFMGNGLTVDHVIEVSLDQFPDLINALGGIDVTAENEICAPGFDGAGEGVNLDRGEHHLDGQDALSFARVRTNPCAPEEDDRARAARQQEVLSGIRSQALSPSTFLRMPFVAWEAPRAIRTDLGAPGLAGLFTDLLTGGTGETNVLDFEEINADGSVIVSEAARADAVDRLMGED
jgi:LCP family protein required for cell wall assembly